MLERTTVLVDTSYLLASFYNSWETGARAQLSIDLPEVVHILGEMIQKQLHQPIHRQYWYDGIPDSGPHRYQRALRTCEGVILRTGQLIEWGERRTQKAVDTRLVADMVLTAVHHTVSDIVLVSGDADMIPGVEEATSAGIRVHLYGFGWDSMSSALRHVCDSTTVLDPREDFTDTMQLQVLEGPVPPAPHIKPVVDGGCPEETGATPLPHLGNEQARADLSASESSAEIVEPAEETSPHVTTDSSEATVARDAAQAAAQAARTPAGTSAAENYSVDQAEQAANRSTRPLENTTDQNGLAQEHADHASLRPDTRAPKIPDTTQPEPLWKEDTPDSAAPQDAAQQEEGLTGDSAGAAHDAAQEGQGVAQGEQGTAAAEESEAPAEPKKQPERPKPSMMAPRRKLRSRYVPLPNEVWTSAGAQTPFDVGQQYATWWFDHAATQEQRDQAHLLSGGGLPPEVDRPLLQFACETLHEYTLSQSQRVDLRDGFHSGIRGVLISFPQDT